MALAPTLKTWLLVVPALALLGMVGYRAGGRALTFIPGVIGLELGARNGVGGLPGRKDRSRR